VATQKTLVAKVVGNGNMHITAKKGVKTQNFTIELAQTKHNWVESRVKSSLVAFFVKTFPMKPWYAMFGIFPRYHITYHDSMHWFSIFFDFFRICFAPFQILVKLAVSAVCARWVGPPSLGWVMGSHTFRVPPGIFPRIF
jgi:hypothetical protein